MRKNDQITLSNKTYILCKKIGEGGNSVVWSAKIDGEDKLYAIKFLNNSEVCKKERFLKEINFCLSSQHGNIVKVFGFDVGDDQICYTMPLYNRTLRDIIDENIDYTLYLDFVLQLCNGIKYIHSQSIVHRDIKPENILIDDNNNLVLADFGIAHFKDSTLTRSKEMMCNRNYSAPEQHIKGNSKNITYSCDIYALGAIINELFTKENPSGSKFVTISDIYPFLSQLDILANKCLLQNPKERPSIEEVITEITLIKGEIIGNIADIKDTLFPDETLKLTGDFVDNILNYASKDILSAKHIFENKIDDELENLNCNYHGNIHYSIDESLKNICFQKKLYNLCLHKFNYESQAYKKGKPYISLNLKNKKDLKIYNAMVRKLEKHRIPNEYSNLTGVILKYFSSFCDYHCKEVLQEAESFETEIASLDDSPILYIIYKLRTIFSLDDTKDFDLANHIYINWYTTNFNSSTENNIYTISPEISTALHVLKELSEKFNMIYTKIDFNYYSIRFENSKTYNSFKRTLLNKSKKDETLYLDTLSVLRVKQEHYGVVELFPVSITEINYVLSKFI